MPIRERIKKFLTFQPSEPPHKKFLHDLPEAVRHQTDTTKPLHSFNDYGIIKSMDIGPDGITRGAYAIANGKSGDVTKFPLPSDPASDQSVFFQNGIGGMVRASGPDSIILEIPDSGLWHFKKSDIEDRKELSTRVSPLVREASVRLTADGSVEVVDPEAVKYLLIADGEVIAEHEDLEDAIEAAEDESDGEADEDAVEVQVFAVPEGMNTEDAETFNLAGLGEPVYTAGAADDSPGSFKGPQVKIYFTRNNTRDNEESPISHASTNKKRVVRDPHGRAESLYVGRVDMNDFSKAEHLGDYSLLKPTDVEMVSELDPSKGRSYVLHIDGQPTRRFHFGPRGKKSEYKQDALDAMELFQERFPGAKLELKLVGASGKGGKPLRMIDPGSPEVSEVPDELDGAAHLTYKGNRQGHKHDDQEASDDLSSSSRVRPGVGMVGGRDQRIGGSLRPRSIRVGGSREVKNGNCWLDIQSDGKHHRFASEKDLKNITVADLKRAIFRGGYKEVNRKGDHCFFRSPDGSRICQTDDGADPVPTRTIKTKFLRDTGWSEEHLFEYLGWKQKGKNTDKSTSEPPALDPILSISVEEFVTHPLPGYELGHTNRDVMETKNGVVILSGSFFDLDSEARERALTRANGQTREASLSIESKIRLGHWLLDSNGRRASWSICGRQDNRRGGASSDRRSSLLEPLRTRRIYHTASKSASVRVTAAGHMLEQAIDEAAGRDLSARQQYEALAKQLLQEGYEDDEIDAKLLQSMKKGLKALDVEGAKLVGESGKYLVYRIDTFEASQRLGSKNWCVVREQKHWDDYTEGNDIRFYYYIDPKKGAPAEYAVAMSPQGQEEVYDQDDKMEPAFPEDLNPTLEGLDDDAKSNVLSFQEEKQEISRSTPEYAVKMIHESKDDYSLKSLFIASMKNPGFKKIWDKLRLDPALSNILEKVAQDVLHRFTEQASYVLGMDPDLMRRWQKIKPARSLDLIRSATYYGITPEQFKPWTIYLDEGRIAFNGVVDAIKTGKSVDLYYQWMRSGLNRQLFTEYPKNKIESILKDQSKQQQQTQPANSPVTATARQR